MLTKTLMSTRLDYIDALRGIAILGVILVHTSQEIVGLSPRLFNFCSRGRYGVLLFFIVSALTLFMSINEREKSKSYSTISFYLRRLFRIAPLYYIGVVFYVLLDGFSSRYWAPNGITWIDIMENFFFLHGWTPTSINSVVPGGWSIATEMCFYIFIPFLYNTLKNIKSVSAAILISIISSQILNQVILKMFSPYYTESNNYLLSSFLYFWFPNQVPIFLFGILLFFLQREYLLVSNKNSRLFSLFFITVSIFFMYGATHLSYIPEYFIFGIAFVILGYSLSLYSNPLFVNKLICFIGNVSFSLYLWHFGVIRIVNHFLKNYISNISPEEALVIYFISIVIISVVIAYISYRVIEIPGIKIGSEIIKKYKQELKGKQVNKSKSVYKL